MYAMNTQHKTEQFLWSLFLQSKASMLRSTEYKSSFSQNHYWRFKEKKNHIPVASWHFLIKGVFSVRLREGFIPAIPSFFSNSPHRYFALAVLWKHTWEINWYKKQLLLELGCPHKLTLSVALPQIIQVLFIIPVSQFAWVDEQSQIDLWVRKLVGTAFRVAVRQSLFLPA